MFAKIQLYLKRCDVFGELSFLSFFFSHIDMIKGLVIFNGLCVIRYLYMQREKRFASVCVVCLCFQPFRIILDHNREMLSSDQWTAVYRPHSYSVTSLQIITCDIFVFLQFDRVSVLYFFLLCRSDVCFTVFTGVYADVLQITEAV